MLIKRVSRISGITREQEIPITEEQLLKWRSGEPIQMVAPCLSADQREFIISGISPEEWDQTFSKVEEGKSEE